MKRSEHAAGVGQWIVIYVSADIGGPVDPNAEMAEIAQDAASWAEKGFRIVSTAAVPMRYSGTASNVFFQTGGGFETQIAIVVVYSNLAG